MNELVALAVPGVRLDAATGLLRVLFVLRLGGTATDLTGYGLTDWPGALAGADLEVRVRTATGDELDPVTLPVRSTADIAVWTAFFGTVDVRPFTPPAPPTVPEPTPTSTHAEAIGTLYAEATTSVGDPATIAAGLDALPTAPPPPAPDPGAPLPRSVSVDLHRAQALLRHHPAVLRRLGLVVEVDVPRALLDAAPGGQLRVGWPGRPAVLDTTTSPWTAFECTSGRFLAASTPLHRRGMVDLGSTTGAVPDWQVVGFDVDGATVELAGARREATEARARVAEGRARPAEAAVALPGLRSAGLQLVHRGRGAEMTRAAERALANADRAIEETVLTADDLVLGYRLDVRFQGRTWYSLMRRRATYTVDDVPVDDLSEEGHVAPLPVVRFEAPEGTVSTADEVVVRWDGGPLAFPAATPGAARRSDRRPGAEGLPYRFDAVHVQDPDEPPGSPPLRFGKSYQLRLRVADIAGGGLACADLDGDESASGVVPCARHEPVLPPVLAPPPGLQVPGPDGRPTVDAAVLGPGGALDRLVVRSDPAGTTPLRDHPPNHERVLTPPTASFSLAEWADLLSGTDADTARLARRARLPQRVSAVPIAGRSYTGIPDPGADGMAVTVLPAAARSRGAGPVQSAWRPEDFPDHPAKVVQLVAGAPGSAASVGFQGQQAVVSLPPGMRAMVEVSSSVDSGVFGRFALAVLAPVTSPAGSAVANGRHPVITPPRVLHVVHAVRRPLSAPAASLVATRVAGGTVAELADPADPLLGVDRDSTVQLDVGASWTEWTDAPGAAGTADVTAAHTLALAPLPVGLDSGDLGPVRHEFGDTRHRRVTYRLTAHSRFRDLFAVDEDPAAFLRWTDVGPVSVPSTARPVAPVVAAVTPSWQWSRTEEPAPEDGLLQGPATVVERSGGWLRVELAAPWWTTGEGEQLGVVVAAAPGTDPALVTSLYRDPVDGTGVPAQPGPGSLLGAAGPPVEVTDRETGTTIAVVPFDVSLVGGRRVADIGFGADAGTAGALVRLRLVRYQADSSEPALTTSPVVTTDLVGLLPARSLRVQVLGMQTAVTLTGEGSRGPVEVRVEQAAAGADLAGPTALTAPDDGVGWQVVSRQPLPAGGSVSLGFGGPGGRRRVVVREFSPLPASTAVVPTDPVEQETRRTTFAAVVEIG